MSLINDMLSDLEKRNSEPKQKEINPFEDFLAPKEEPKPQNTFKPNDIKNQVAHIVAVIVILVSVIVISLLVFRVSFDRYKTAKTEAKPTPLSVAQKQQPIAKPNPVEKKPVTLEKILIEQDEATTQFILLLSDPTHYDVDISPDHKKLVLTINNIKTDQQLPDMSQIKTAISSISLNQMNSDLQFIINLQKDTTIKSVKMEKEPKQLVINFVRQKSSLSQQLVEATSGAPSFKKVVVPLTPEQMATEKYHKAENLIATDQLDDAKAELANILIHMPTYLPARKTLIILLMQQGQNELAMRFIDNGLSQSPTNFELIKLKARLFAIEKKPQDAIAVLQKNPPQISDDPEYFSILAALQQQAGKPEYALQIYRQLLSVNSNVSAWWAGFGISSEKLGQINAAADAYQKALTIGGLNPNLQMYIQSRLYRLQGS